MKGSTKKKGPYANSLTEGAMKQLSMDLKELKDEEFKKKYKMTKQEARKNLSAKPEPVSEARLEEEDIVLVPGQGRKMKTGFVPNGKSRIDHEVEMARSDLISAAKNAESIYRMIESTSEDEGLQGWVQEKIIKANDYLNSVREYLEGKEYQSVAEGSKEKTPGVALSKAYKKDFDNKKPGHTKPETALTGTYSKTGKPGGDLKKQGVEEGRATYGPVTDAHKAASKKVFSAGVKDGKAGAEKNKQHMASALMKTTYLNGYKQGAAEGKSK
jgi:hypothetical protein